MLPSRKWGGVRTFTIFMLDDRYKVPTVAFVEAPDAHAATALARRRLDESPHHRAAEVREADRPVGMIWRTPPTPEEGIDVSRISEALHPASGAACP